MVKVPVILLLCSLVSTIMPQSPSLSLLKDKNRVLLVFAPTDSFPAYQQQVSQLQRHQQELQQRDLVLIPVLTHVGPQTSANTLRDLHAPVASDSEQIELRQRFHVPINAFTVILIGKDGGEKLRCKEPIQSNELFATIDAMPMRRDEMKQRQ